ATRPAEKGERDAIVLRGTHFPLHNKTFRKLQILALGPTLTTRHRPRRHQNDFTTCEQAQAPLCFHWNHWKPYHTTCRSIHYGTKLREGKLFSTCEQRTVKLPPRR